MSDQLRPIGRPSAPHRRSVLEVGALSAMGLSLGGLLRAEEKGSAGRSLPASTAAMGSTFGKAKNCIFLWLQGGPPQHETFDPKPEAPAEIRGPFKPIATNVTGIRFSELLPRTARHADKMAVLRSLSTRDDNHDVSGYWLMTGYAYGPGSARQIKPTDWPYFGSIVKMLKPSERMPALTTVWIPDLMRLNDNVTPAGQTAGFLGKIWEPARFVGDPAASDYHIEGLGLTGDMSRTRFDDRRGLLHRLNATFELRSRNEAIESWDRLSQHAVDLVTSGRARSAFDLSREPDKLRDRYGRHTWGQSVLLARRLVEAGVRLVHVNWPRDPGDSAVDNPLWDTHAQNADRLQDSLCPMFDVSFDALMDDLSDRGLLQETLVVVVGEFGRTPKINKQGGRDHWGHVFSMAFAGAGIAGGQVIGASDKNGSYPTTDPILGGDVTATIFHLLGIDPGGMFIDKTHRPHPITKGEPVASALRPPIGGVVLQRSTGDPSVVPPFDSALIPDPHFTTDRSLIPVAPASREKGWRADPIGDARTTGLSVWKHREGTAIRVVGGMPSNGRPLADRAVLAQEIRNARGGHYSFHAEIIGEGESAEQYAREFAGRYAVRMVLFRFRDSNKDPRNVDELASADVAVEFDRWRTFKVDRFLASHAPGVNFPIGNGLGIAVVVSARGKADPTSAFCGIRVRTVRLEFSAAPRDENNVL